MLPFSMKILGVMSEDEILVLQSIECGKLLVYSASKPEIRRSRVVALSPTRAGPNTRMPHGERAGEDTRATTRSNTNSISIIRQNEGVVS